MNLTLPPKPKGKVASVEELIEFAGLRDIAEEVGIVQPGAGEAGPSSAAPRTVDGAIAPAIAASCAACAVSDAPAQVRVPSYGGGGPAVPEALAGMVGADGKKKRSQRSHGGKGGDKGLRHFSMKVCEKVEQKGRTTYNEVADELVAEFVNAGIVGDAGEDGVQYDEKNIRRRVYDALNVLMAMEIITKEKKQILWKGLPSNTQQESTRMQMDLSSRQDRLHKKRLHLQELITQQISFMNLIKRNRAGNPAAASPSGAAPGAAGASADGGDGRIPLPFILINSKKETVIDCEMAEDKQEIFFNFSAPFEIHDDNETLKRMRMQYCAQASDIRGMVPEGLVEFTSNWHQLAVNAASAATG